MFSLTHRSRPELRGVTMEAIRRLKKDSVAILVSSRWRWHRGEGNGAQRTSCSAREAPTQRSGTTAARDVTHEGGAGERK
jgi:hypothetical protein